VEHAVHEILSELLVRRIKDPRVAGVTITGVRITGDLRHATVFIAASGRTGADEQEALTGMRSALGLMRSEVGRQLGLRHAPELATELDPSLDYAERIERLLAQGKGEPGEEGESEEED
jgi:ribosome-binding factor A